MKSFVLLLALVAVVALSGNSPSPSPVAASPQIEALDLAELAKRSPLCDCGDKCECAEPCLCNTVDQEPLKVGQPPDQAALQVAAENFTEPKPQVYPTVPTPKPQVYPTLPKATPVATGHWQNVQSCGRGGCSVSRVWVPHAAAAPVQQSACGPGGCGVRRGLFGRRR